MIRKPNGKRPGVSLIEVLLATAIFLMAVASISVLMSGAADSAIDTNRINLCSSLAPSKIAHLEEGVGDVSLTSGGSGTFPDYPNLSWDVTCEPTAYLNAYDVTVRVYAPNSARKTEVVLSQLIFDPAYLNNAGALTAPTTGTTP